MSDAEDLLVAAVAVIRRWGASHNRDAGAPRWLDAMLEALVAAEVLEPAKAGAWRAHASEERARGAGATVLCVALYAQCFLVHGITQPAVASRRAHFRAEDDLGTRYLARRGGGGAGPGRTMEFTYVLS